MNKVFRQLLVAILALAIPLQGFASTTMLLCKAGHHSPMTTSMHDGHSNDHMDQSVRVEKTVKPLSHHSVSKEITKCEACGFCCNVSALVSSGEFIRVLPMPASQPDFNAITPHWPHLKGLKRPPRDLRA